MRCKIKNREAIHIYTARKNSLQKVKYELDGKGLKCRKQSQSSSGNRSTIKMVGEKKTKVLELER